MSKTPIAIVGMAGIFPQARNIKEYWSNIINEIDCITEVPASRWKIEDYYDPDPNTPDKTYCKRGGFIPDIDFNPMEFGLPPNILEVTDVAQLLSLVVAKEALADAGYQDAKESIRQRTGVVLGIGGGQKLITPLTSRLQYTIWEKVLRDSGLYPEDIAKIIDKIKLAYVPWTENSFPGMLGNVISGRVANRLDLGGMNCVVDAACASSLSALQMALSELTEHRSDMMITGGVDTDNSIFMYMSFSKTPAFSPQGQIRPFDADADGMLIGEALGMMVLKRLSDAERDGDRIYAVIKGMGTSSDGKYKSIYAPRSSGQALALRRAYQDAGFAPKTVGMIEAHGTGTVTGDPAEFEGLKQVFSENNSNKSHIALGSVKSQIGHTKSAAGAVSMIKVALGLHHKVLPATINVNQPNPKLEIEDSPFYLNTKTRPWLTANQSIPRRAGVSSFGFGGTNFHVVLEEYQAEGEDIQNSLLPTANSILLQAIAPDKLLAQCQTIIEQLKSDEGERIHRQIINDSQNLDVSLTSARVGFITQSLPESIEKLWIIINYLSQDITRESWEHPQDIYYRQTGIDPQAKVVALFSGQGSQYLEMGRELAIQYPEMCQAYQRMDDVFIQDNLEPISAIVYPQPVFEQTDKDVQFATLNKTENAQPAIGAFNMGLYKIAQKIGLQPDIIAGHSFGELTALWAAQVLSDRDYCFLVKSRAQAMADKNIPNSDSGKMLAVLGNIHRIEAIVKELDNITIANHNSDKQVVLAGKSSDILAIKTKLETLGFTAILLPVSAAFHTPLVSHARKTFAEALNRVNFQSPQIPVYSNTTANIYPQNSESIKNILTEHLLNPVRFKTEIEHIYQTGGRIFIEFGAKNVLTKLIDNILEYKPHVAICLHDRVKDDLVAKQKYRCDLQLPKAILHLKVLGLPLKSISPQPQKPKAKDNIPGLTVKLNGANYVSDRTKKAFVDNLESKINISEYQQLKQDKQEKKISQDTNVDSTPQKSTNKIFKQEYKSNHQQENLVMTLSSPQPLNHNFSQSALDPNLVDVLMKFQEHQTQVNRTHQQYLESQAAYRQQFLQLLQPQLSIDPHLMSETNSVRLTATENILNEQLPNSNSSSKKFIEIGGQDKLKESNASFNHHYPLNEINKIDEIVAVENETKKLEVTDTSTEVSAATTTTATENKSLSAVKSLTSDPAPPICGAVSFRTGDRAYGSSVARRDLQATLAVERASLAESLLTVVSEKTGYPSQMLELEMDMEADLGIDSIKRVEIMGAMQELYSDLPPFNPEELAELKTLGQIVNYIGKHDSFFERSNETHEILAVESEANKPEDIKFNNQISDATIAKATENTSSIELESLTESLLTVVSEKTGYPSQMLELEMDMEADLGIDSIKRVEIMGAMQELYPDLPPFNPEELAELRTLGQIINYMGQQSGGIKKKLMLI